MTVYSAGSVAARLTYYPYGGTRTANNTPGINKLFTGQRLDDTGLYYCNARYY